MNIIVRGFGKYRGKQICLQIREMILSKSFRWSQRVDINFGYSHSENPIIIFEDIEDCDTKKVCSLIVRLKKKKIILKNGSTLSSITCSGVPVRVSHWMNRRMPSNPVAELFERL